MNKLSSPQELESLRQSITAARDAQKPCITVCSGTGCHAHGSEGLIAAFKDEIARQNLADKVDIRITGCHGFCEQGPLVVIKPENIFYRGAAPEDVAEIISETIGQGNIVDRLLYTDPATQVRLNTSTTYRSTRSSSGLSSATTV